MRANFKNLLDEELLSQAPHLRNVDLRGKQERNKINSQTDVVSENRFIDS